jgi:cation transporter-like permease
MSAAMRFLRNLLAFVGFESLELVASLLGVLAVALYIVAAYFIYGFLTDMLASWLALLLSLLFAVAIALPFAYLSVRLGKFSD